MINLTKFFIVCIIVVVLAFDSFIMFHTNNEVTISSVVLDYSKQYPIIPFVMGLIAGHLFW